MSTADGFQTALAAGLEATSASRGRDVTLRDTASQRKTYM